MSMVMNIFKNVLVLGLGVLLVSCGTQTYDAPKAGVAAKFDSVKDNGILLRAFLQDMPKGGDLHTHLVGAVYPESWLAWAVEDGLCIDTKALAIRFPTEAGCGVNMDAKSVLAGNQILRNELIDRFSVRDFIPTQGWSGHDQFFRTFSSFNAMPHRFGDMLAETANRAGRQNIGYLELLHTVELFETILPMVVAHSMTGDPAIDYESLMAGPFGKALPEMLTRAKAGIDTGLARKDELLGCGTQSAQVGCEVEIRFLHQPIRTLPASAVFAHTIFGWHLMKADPRFVGTNLVAPEDDFIALRDYGLHMEQIAHLYETLGPRNISLHAGELWLGLVAPKELRSHIHDAVHIAYAKRIGHGTDIVFEDGYKDLLKYMADNEILVEINLTSSDVILGVINDAHPTRIYQNAGVPLAFSTDDEGVARIDLTHEYMRAVTEQGLSYAQLKATTYNSLKYSFVDETTKTALLAKLDQRFLDFEKQF